MTFTYTDDVPVPTHEPRADVGAMQVNTASIKQLINVDHVSFNETTSGLTNHQGEHKQLHFPAFTAQAAPVVNASIAYTKAGIADANTAQLNFVNANGTYLSSAVKAFCSFTSLVNVAGALTFTPNYLNIASVVQSFSSSTNTIAITFTANSVVGANYTAIVNNYSSAGFSSVGFQLTKGTGSINIDFATSVARYFDVMILQA